MNELETLQLFISEIESVVDVPVRMSKQDDDHESEMVLIDSLDTTREARATNPYIGISDDGNEILQFYHNARMDLTVQSESEETAYHIRQSIIDHFGVYEKYPKRLDDEIVKFKLGDGGERTAQFEPTVFRLFKQVQAFKFAFTDNRAVDADTLEVIEDNL